MRLQRAGLRLRPGADVEVIDPNNDARFRQYWETYHRVMGRDGITPEMAKATVRRSATVIGALAIQLGDADAMICGMVGRFDGHFEHVQDLIGLRAGAKHFATMNAVMMEEGTLFLTDTYVNTSRTRKRWPRSPPWLLRSCCASVCRPRWPLSRTQCSAPASAFGVEDAQGARAVRRDPSGSGERRRDARRCGALGCRARHFLPDSKLEGSANLLVLPTLDSANILVQVLKISSGSGKTVGPILLGSAAPVHILTPSATVRRIVNMTALAVADAGAAR